MEEEDVKKKTKKKQKQPTALGLDARRLKKKRRRGCACNVKIRRGKDWGQASTVSPLVEKYWFQRYKIFSRFHEGIKLDEEGWYSATPEEIAIRHAEKCRGRIVIDCFAGVGGNAIQFARVCSYVLAIDIDPQKVELALHNAKIYGVEDRIDFITGDIFQLAPSVKILCIFLLHGVALHTKMFPTIRFTYSSRKMEIQISACSCNTYSTFQIAQAITPNIIMFLPRNVDLNQVEELSWLSSPPRDIEIEKNYVDGSFKGTTVYFGSFDSKSTIISGR